MIFNDIVRSISESGYMAMNSNLINMAVFSKTFDKVADVVLVVVNSNMTYNKEQLESIAFQIERKFLLKGSMKVNIQYVVMTDNIDRDKDMCTCGNASVWFADLLANRIISFENFNDEFKDLYSKLDDTLAMESGSQVDESEKVDLRKIPFVTIGLFVVNMIVFLLVELNGSSYDTEYMLKCGAADWKLIFREHEYYRLVTCMFLHFGISHIANNMFSLLIVGKDVEKIYGRVRMLIIYFVSGIGASLVSAYVNMVRGQEVVSAGASGAIFGIIGAVVIGSLFESGEQVRNVRRVFILILIMALCGSGHVDNAAHAGGFLVGVAVSFIIMLIMNRKRAGMEEEHER